MSGSGIGNRKRRYTVRHYASIESYKDRGAGQNGLFGLLTFGRSPGSEWSGREGGIRKLGYMPLSIQYVKTERNREYTVYERSHASSG